ncbi:MAG: gamma-glutamylcyclotransferase family protein [Bacteroidota bacterium]
MEDNITYLFVYGTLQQASGHPMSKLLRKNATPIGPGEMSGSLYQIGEYPGAVFESESNNRVYGDVYEITKPEQLLHRLDHYEGYDSNAPQRSLFVRKKHVIYFEEKPLECWVYIYNRPTYAHKRIPSGRYIQSSP